MMYIEYPAPTSGTIVARWYVGTPVNKLPEQLCTVQADGDELDYALQFVPHGVYQIDRVVKFYGFDGYRIVCGINEDYALPKVQRYPYPNEVELNS